MSSRKVVLTTIGTMGDLHPFIAIALALQRRGFSPVLAVAADQITKPRYAGLEAFTVLSPFSVIAQRMVMSEQAAVKRLVRDQRAMLEQVLLPELKSSADALHLVAEGAEAIVASTFMFAAPMVAEQRGVPLVSVVLQPMAMLSPYDPPTTPDFWMMRRPRSWGAVSWNRMMFGVLRLIVDWLYGPRIDAARRARGLTARGAKDLFDTGREAALTLCCYSAWFAPPPPDAPQQAQTIGFPIFDSSTGEVETLDPALAKFLAAGTPPIVFTLGTFAVHSAANFYGVAADAARLIGARAVLLTGEENNAGQNGDVFRCAYAPHSLLFPYAAAVVHHGGIGTTGQALRSGRPQLVVPHMGDQYDHASRIERMGLGHQLIARRFTARRASRMLTALMNDVVLTQKAREVAEVMGMEDGADAAAQAIAHLLNRT